MRIYRAALVIILFLATLLFFNAPGTWDVSYYFLPWMDTVSQFGLREGYALNSIDYPPLTSAILLGVVESGRVLHLPYLPAFKLSLLLFLSLTSLLFYLWTRHFSLTILLHASLILNSLGLGYVDVYYMPFLLGALWAFQRNKWAIATLLLSIACFTKWQPIIIAPVAAIFLLTIHHWHDWQQIPFKRLLQQVLVPFAGLQLLFIWLFGSTPLATLFTAMDDPFLSGNALNLQWIATYIFRLYYPELYGGLINGGNYLVEIGDGNHYVILARYIFFGLYGLVLLLWLGRPKNFTNLLWFSILAFFTYVTFNTGVHENHIFLICLIAAVLAWQQPEQMPLFVILALIGNLNIFLFYGLDGQDLPFSRVVFGQDISVWLAGANVLFYGLLAQQALWQTRPRIRDNFSGG